MDKAEIYKDLYSQFEVDSPQEHRTREILKLLRGYSFGKFLDIGCGVGGVTMLMAKAVQAREIKAIEISDEGVMKAREKGIECVKVDLDRDVLPFEGEQFDFIFCGDIIEHLFDTDRLVEYLFRVLKPGGKLLITTPNFAAWHNRIYLLLGYNPFLCSVSLKHHKAGKLFHISSGVGKEHLRHFTLRALEDLLVYNQFTVMRRFGFYAIPHVSLPKPLQMIVTMIEKGFSKFPGFATTIGVLCEKQ